MDKNGLTIRQYVRDDVSLPVEFEVDPDHSAQVCFHGSSSAQTPAMFCAVATDISSGGIGIVTTQYLPRMCSGILRVPGDKGGRREIIFEHAVVVRRVRLVDHVPTYAIGLAFVALGPDIGERIEELRRLAFARMGGSRG